MNRRWFYGVLASTLLFQNCSPDVNFSAVESSSETPQAETTSQLSSLNGTVTNALDSSHLQNVTVKIRKANAPTQTVATTTTTSSGQYSIKSLSAGSYLVDFSASGYVSLSDIAVTLTSDQQTTLNASLTTAVSSNQIRIVLNWCSEKSGAVEDIDSYLSVPGVETPVYFGNKTATSAQLDIDVRNWSGPETITITNVLSGTYTYYVNNYDSRFWPSALGNSDVRIAVYKGSSLLKTYSVPTGSGLTYEVFRIVNGSLVDVNAYNSSLSVAY